MPTATKLTEQEIKEILKQKGPEIAQCLGDGWTFNFEEERFGPSGDLIKDRYRISISSNYQSKGRFVISGRYEHSPHITLPPYIGITVDPSKEAYVIARDINKRLLPEYEQNFAIFLQREKDQNEHVARLEKRVAEILAIDPKAHKNNWREQHSEAHVYFSEGEMRISGGIDEDCVRLEFRTDLTTAKTFLKELMSKREKLETEE